MYYACICIQLEDITDVKHKLEELQKNITEMGATMHRINAPNMKAMEK